MKTNLQEKGLSWAKNTVLFQANQDLRAGLLVVDFLPSGHDTAGNANTAD